MNKNESNKLSLYTNDNSQALLLMSQLKFLIKYLLYKSLN